MLMCVCSVKPPLYRFAFFCVVCVCMQLSVRSVCLLWNAAVNEPLCPHCMVQQPTCAHTHTQSLTHILLILTQTRLLGEFMYESRFCSPGTVRLSYISQCSTIHPSTQFLRLSNSGSQWTCNRARAGVHPW